MSKKLKGKYAILAGLLFYTHIPITAHIESAPIEAESNKYVIGSRPYGMFSIFLQAVNHIEWCIRNNKTPVIHWKKDCLYYTGKMYNNGSDGWTYYFQPVSDLTYEDHDQIHCNYESPDGSYVVYFFDEKTQPSREYRRDIYERVIKPFIKLNPIVQHKVDSFWEQNMQGKNTIGIHLRGTDKYLESMQISREDLLHEAQKHAGPDTQFLVATDEERLLELAKRILKGTIIYYDSHRSHNNNPIHHNGPFPMELAGEEVVIETMLLARCDKMVHSCSNVSTAVLLLNPDLDNILLHKLSNPSHAEHAITHKA